MPKPEDEEISVVLYLDGAEINWVASDGSSGAESAAVEGQFESEHWARIEADIVEKTGAIHFEWL